MQTKLKINNEEYKKTELGLLPKDWDVVEFEECLSNKKIKISKIQQLQFKKIGKYPIVDQSQELISGYWDNEEDLFTSPLPIIVFGDHTRTLKFIDFPFVCGPDGTKILITNKSKAYPRFFYYYLKSLNIPSRGYNRHYSLLKDYLIPLPSLPEQQKIAFVLSTIQYAGEKNENVINSLKELKKALMKHLFTYGAVSFEDAEKVKLKDTEIGKVPKDWEVKELKNIATLQRGKDLPKQNWKEGTVPIVGSSGIMGHHNEAVCKAPGVITGRSGSIGKLIYLKEDYWPHNTALYVKNFYENSPKFIYYLMHTLDFKKYATGVSVPTLNRNFIHMAKKATPSLAEQQKIASILSAVDEKIEAEENKRKALDELFKSMLHNLMTAKVRVKDLVVANG